jgi:hypothetical protein
MLNILFQFLQYVVSAYRYCYSFFALPTNGTHTAYFLSETNEIYVLNEIFTQVPEDYVYIDEWMNAEGHKLCYIRYEGESIENLPNPFTLPAAKCPWVWIGDKTTEIDLTRAFNKFLVPGNRIEMDLILKMIHVMEDSDLEYLRADTMAFEKFPGDGILIESNE